MDIPDLARERLGDESVVGEVTLGGDTVLVTPTRTLVYRADGLLSDESVAEFPHDAERVELREGRRKATFKYTYVDGTRDFSVPADRIDDLLAPLLWGVLHGADVIDGDETVQGAYRFSDLTFVITEARAVKHVGSALWNDEFEQFPYTDLTDLNFEEGSVATSVVFEVAGRRERVKAPNEQAGLVRRTIEEAVLDYHGVDSLEEFRTAVETDDEYADEGTSGTGVLDTGEFESLVKDAGPSAPGGASGVHEGETDGDGDTSGRADSTKADVASKGDVGVGSDIRGASSDEEADTGSAPIATTRVEDRDGVAEQIAALTKVVRRQNELLERQQATIEQLVQELRRSQ